METSWRTQSRPWCFASCCATPSPPSCWHSFSQLYSPSKNHSQTLKSFKPLSIPFNLITYQLSIFRANIAAAAGGIIFFCLYLPYSFMVVWEEVLNPNAKILSCLVSNIAFGFGCAYFSHYEESGVGAQWSNIWTSPLTDDKFSHLLFMF